MAAASVPPPGPRPAARVARAAARRLRPDRAPRTAGLRFARTRPEAVLLLNHLAAGLAAEAGPRTPALWVTSLARSIEQQRRLRALGYAASLPSAHCVGYAMDIEMAWFAQFGARPALEALLLGLQQAGQANVIDEGQAWHVCVSPDAAAGLRAGTARTADRDVRHRARPRPAAGPGHLPADDHVAAPRGELEEVLLTDRLLACTQRLRIVDAEHASSRGGRPTAGGCSATTARSSTTGHCRPN